MAAVPTDGVLDNNNSEPLKYKRWVLKVSIHCEGCKRKVKRILHSVEGVYTIDVDARQHRVVVTGNVDANTLIRKLEKSGKHADLWPDFHKVSNNNNQVNEQQQQEDVPQNQNQNPNIDNQKVDNNSNKSQKVADNCAQQQQQPPQQQPQQQVKEVRFEGNVPGESPANNPPGGGGSGGDGGGGAKKKKKKKKSNGANNNTTNNGANNNNNGSGDVANVVMEQGNNDGPASAEPQPPPPPNPAHNPNPVNMSSPRQHPPNNRVYEYPYPYYTPPPVYAVSYNTAYPSSNYSTSYYSTPRPYSYAYVHQGGDVEGPAPLDWNPNAVPPSDSFEIFSDENPNACSVM